MLIKSNLGSSMFLTAANIWEFKKLIVMFYAAINCYLLAYIYTDIDISAISQYRPIAVPK